MADTLYFVIPCYKEEAVLPITAPVFVRKLRRQIAAGLVSENSRVLFVNDGSPDKTWECICAAHAADPIAVGIDLEKNSGEKNALLAGMYYAAEKADFVITMDCDLQDDIEATDEMIARYYQGNDIVLGVRASRGDDPLSQRFFSAAFYLMMRLLRTGLVSQHSNFRLMSKSAVEALKPYDNIPYFLPAAASTLPFARTTVSHARAARPAGESKYNYKSLTRLAVDAVLVHSAVLPWLTLAGLVLCAAAFIAGLVLLIVFGANGQGFSGWSFVLALGGALGALGFAVMGAWLARLGLYKSYARKSGVSKVKTETGNGAGSR